MDISGVHGCKGRKVWFINSMVTEKARKRTILSPKEPTIKIKFLRLDFAWWIPSAASTLNKFVLAAFLTGWVSFALPETADNGETFAALFAGVRAAISTVNSPTTTPAIMLGKLVLKRGIAPKYSGLKSRRTKQSTHITTTPIATPTGMADLHQIRASLRTIRITCFGVAPTQRINPKNSVRCATLLFRLLVIIIIPANRTRTNRTAAAA